jgi:hypothetical protein
VASSTVLTRETGWRRERKLNIPRFLADCPACNEKVTAFLVRGSLENLLNEEGDVELAHLTNDPHVGDHRWILNDPQAKARLRKLVAPSQT